jgi:hypothetical protein
MRRLAWLEYKPLTDHRICDRRFPGDTRASISGGQPEAASGGQKNRLGVRVLFSLESSSSSYLVMYL